MRNKPSKITISIALAILGLIYVATIHAQSNGTKSNSPPITTNWVGCLVIGEKDTVDAISPGAHPKPIQNVQIGLRSDGVVVWRNWTTGK